MNIQQNPVEKNVTVMEYVSCNICESCQYDLVYQIDVNYNVMRYYRYARNIPNKENMTGTFSIVRCKRCRLLFTNPRFIHDAQASVYSSNRILGGNWKNFMYLFDQAQNDECQDLNNEKLLHPDYGWKFDIIRDYAPGKEKTSLLDLGCGTGHFVLQALEQGFDAWGVDISQDRIRYAQQTLKLEDRVQHGKIEEAFPNRTFDIITLWDVIEHIHDPKALLNSLKQVAHSQTHIFVLTMSIDSITYKLFRKRWNYINPTQHLFYCSDSTIRELFVHSGWEVLGKTMDDSRSKNFLRLLTKVIIGQLNNFFFQVYAPISSKFKIFKPLFKPLQKKISDERMQKRLENLYPGMYVGRYHDNFVFIGRLKAKT